MVIHFGGKDSGKLALRERIVFIEGFTVAVGLVLYSTEWVD